MNLENLKGLTEATAISQIQSAGLKARVTRRDQKYSVVTRDYRPDRINLEIDSGRVSRASIG